MGQYDEIVASYLEKQEQLRAQLRVLEPLAKSSSAKVGEVPVSAIVHRLEREIRDLDGAIKRCRRKENGVQSELPPVSVRWKGMFQDNDRGDSPSAPGEPGQHAMVQVIFHCPKANRVIATGIEMNRNTFAGLARSRAMRCKFCGDEHAWEVIERTPKLATLLSRRAEDFLGRAAQSDAYAAQATDPAIRKSYERMASQWFRLAVEQEAKSDALQDS